MSEESAGWGLFWQRTRWGAWFRALVRIEQDGAYDRRERVYVQWSDAGTLVYDVARTLIDDEGEGGWRRDQQYLFRLAGGEIAGPLSDVPFEVVVEVAALWAEYGARLMERR